MSAPAPSTSPEGSWAAEYFVPWSQVHPGSRGGQTGNVHLIWQGTAPVTLPGLRTPRGRHDALCSPSRRAWMRREPYPGENENDRCPRCAQLAEKHSLAWPEIPDRR